jgi:O-antigen ligase
MNRALFFSRCYYILIGIAVLSIPFTYISHFFITPLLLTFWIIEGNWKEKWLRLKESNTLIITFGLALFWFINIIGLFNSNDLVRGLLRSYDKLPFLVYPLVFFTLDKTFFTEKKMLYLFKGFVIATTLMLLMCWGNAFIQYIITKKSSFFYYSNFTLFINHPAYCALLVCVALITTFHFFNSIKKLKWLWVILLLFFIISIYFLQSRSGILALVLIFIFSLFYYLHIHKKSYWYGIGGMIIILLSIFMLIKLFPNRVDYYFTKTTTELLQPKEIVGLRSEIWDISYQLAMENKMSGIGTGYYNENFLQGEKLEIVNQQETTFINAHNQFLQTFLEHGIFGFCILTFLFFYTFYLAIKTKNYLLLVLLISYFINNLFESMLECGHGIFTFNLFFCLFVVKNNIFVPFFEKPALKQPL